MTAQIEGRPDDEVHASFEFVVVPERDQWAIAHDDRPVALLVLEGEWVDQLYVDPPSRLDMKFSVSVAQPNQRRARRRQVADHDVRPRRTA